jgi:hypothetical protein
MKGWRLKDGAVVVSRPTRWGNPFRYRHHTGLVRYQPATPDVYEYEGRISADGMRHDYFHPDGTVTRYMVRYATRAELVALYRATLLDPTPSMVQSHPGRRGQFLDVTTADIRAELAGRDLACWCPPGPCHADVLLEVANQ